MKKKFIDIQTTSYTERPSKKTINSCIIKVANPEEYKITCIEVAQTRDTVSSNDGKLIITGLNYYTDNIEVITIPFSLFNTNKPTNNNNQELVA